MKFETKYNVVDKVFWLRCENMVINFFDFGSVPDMDK